MMWRIRESLSRFMMGRYGVDKFSFFLLGTYLVIAVINMFVRTPVITILELLLIAYVFFRALSRNVYRRGAENTRFLAIWGAVTGWFRRTGTRIREVRTKVYHKCPNCKATLRLPRRKGKHTVSCPKCHRDFQIKIWF